MTEKPAIHDYVIGNEVDRGENVPVRRVFTDDELACIETAIKVCPQYRWMETFGSVRNVM
jgi:hypothetical protein